MATKAKTKAQRASTRATGTAEAARARTGTDAIALLQADHRQVDGYFTEYEALDGLVEKKALADKICLALSLANSSPADFVAVAAGGRIWGREPMVRPVF